MPGGKHQSCLWIILLTFGVRQTVDAKPPNIIFMVADDLGWNDVGFNNPDIISPNLNKLAAEGVILNQSYVQPVCTPTWSSCPSKAVCAPLNRTFLPQELKKLGYATHAVGKSDNRLQSGDSTQADVHLTKIIGSLPFVFDPAQNGGWTQFYGNNFPLRGGKVTVWEGGTRAAAFLHGWGLQKTGSRYNGMMHAVDWFPTIITAAGGEVKDKDIDGMSMWEAISTFGPSPRTEFIYNLDNSSLPLQGHAAIRQGDFKLIKGFPGLYSGWYPPDQEYDPQSDLEAYSNMLKYQDIRGIARLYNVKDDPTEHVDLAANRCRTWSSAWRSG
ncbi:hypothetical protein C0Q70_02455 [Pomacea canaliculata]|uniref:Sulfatase N-terminal domain-containing protein n=1 Tax=Pomacea canaliculata TaxID=400727 RepID=A0A2T7PPZ4_POMCA|nr:hypothetical protein C0Q70_02455 [Pomacea canaliculata]